MNKRERLISATRHCESIKLRDLCKIQRGVRVIKKQLGESGKYPVYQNSLKPLGFYDQSNFPANTSFMICAGAAGQIGFSDVDFWAADDCFCFLPSDKLNDKYLFYFLKANQFYFDSRVRNASIPRLSKASIENFNIILPSLAEQEEIVRILDTFTALSEKLNQELEFRKKQYEYYRDILLNRSGNRISLGDIGKVCMCKRIMKNQTNTKSGIPFFKIGTFGGTADAYIPESLYDEYRIKYSYPQKGDILISASGTIGRRVVYNGDPAYFQDSNIIWIDNNETIITNRFLYYLYEVIEWKTEGGTIKRLYNDNLKRTEVVVPSLSEQERIVSILDKFNTLINDQEKGLPAEIRKVQQQYEYYREKLLTF